MSGEAICRWKLAMSHREVARSPPEDKHLAVRKAMMSGEAIFM